jgi:hypothetical protein
VKTSDNPATSCMTFALETEKKDNDICLGPRRQPRTGQPLILRSAPPTVNPSIHPSVHPPLRHIRSSQSSISHIRPYGISISHPSAHHQPSISPSIGHPSAMLLMLLKLARLVSSRLGSTTSRLGSLISAPHAPRPCDHHERLHDSSLVDQLRARRAVA